MRLFCKGFTSPMAGNIIACTVKQKSFHSKFIRVMKYPLPLFYERKCIHWTYLVMGKWIVFILFDFFFYPRDIFRINTTRKGYLRIYVVTQLPDRKSTRLNSSHVKIS